MASPKRFTIKQKKDYLPTFAVLADKNLAVYRPTGNQVRLNCELAFSKSSNRCWIGNKTKGDMFWRCNLCQRFLGLDWEAATKRVNASGVGVDSWSKFKKAFEDHKS